MFVTKADRNDILVSLKEDGSDVNISLETNDDDDDHEYIIGYFREIHGKRTLIILKSLLQELNITLKVENS